MVEFFSYEIASNDFRQAGAASRSVKEHLKRVGADAEAIRRAVIAAYEAEMNVVIHSVGGRMDAALSDSRLDVTVSDWGPGIADLELAMTEGFSTASPEARALGFGAGMGLPNIKKNADRLRITSRLGEGTRLSFTVFLKPAAATSETPSISLQASPDQCRDCRACLRACPTQAMRVRDSHPMILEHLCIDCAECIAACETGALAVRDDAPSLDHIENRQEAVLVVPPGLLASCGLDHSPGQVMTALESLGFAEVLISAPFEEAVSRMARPLDAALLPAILPVCPAVINLVELRFPALIKHVAPYESPWETIQAVCQNRRAVYVISCPAQRSAILLHHLAGQNKSEQEPIFVTPETVLQAVMTYLSGHKGKQLPSTSPVQPSIAPVTRSPDASPEERARVLRVTGLKHVIAVFERVEDLLLQDVHVIEPYACPGGCMGSPLLPEEYHVTRFRWELAEAELASRTGSVAKQEPEANLQPRPRRRPLRPRPGIRLDPDMARAIQKLGELQAIIRALPGKDCGVCGAPSCAALAEDVVMSRADIDRCPYRHTAQEDRTDETKRTSQGS